MKQGKINANGELYIKRGKTWIKQMCHKISPVKYKGNTELFYCDHTCPLFKEQIKTEHGTFLTLCSRTILFKIFTDERT